MTNYEPSSRRPIAGMFRATARGAVNMAVRAGIHPDVFSYASIVAAGAAGILFWQSARHPKYLILGVAFALLRLWLNMFDGMVALAAGKASKKGEIINDLPDRVSDVVIFVGMAHSRLVPPASRRTGWPSWRCSWRTSGSLARPSACSGSSAAMMSKPWRIVVLSIGAVATSVMVHLDRPYWFDGWLLIDWTNFLIIAGCAQTIVVRLMRIFRALTLKAT